MGTVAFIFVMIFLGTFLWQIDAAQPERSMAISFPNGKWDLPHRKRLAKVKIATPWPPD
jgi:hypothetical protein